MTATNGNGPGGPSVPSLSVTPTAPVTAPGAPTSVTAVGGNQLAVVRFSAPASDGGSPITGYTATVSPGGATCTTSTTLRCTVTGLTNGTPYTFSVTATNAVNTGPPAVSNSATPVPLTVTLSASGASPPQLAYQSGAIVHLTSPALVGAGGYQLSNGPNCTGGLNFSNPSGADFNFDLTGLSYDMTYWVELDPLGPSPTCVGAFEVVFAS